MDVLLNHYSFKLITAIKNLNHRLIGDCNKRSRRLFKKIIIKKCYKQKFNCANESYLLLILEETLNL